jgi:hypothetical protein
MERVVQERRQYVWPHVCRLCNGKITDPDDWFGFADLREIRYGCRGPEALLDDPRIAVLYDAYLHASCLASWNGFQGFHDVLQQIAQEPGWGTTCFPSILEEVRLIWEYDRLGLPRPKQKTRYV